MQTISPISDTSKSGFVSDQVYCVATDLVLNQGLVSTEELQTLADPQYVLTPPCLLLGPMGGQPFPHSQLHQLHGRAGRWHLQTGCVLQEYLLVLQSSTATIVK